MNLQSWAPYLGIVEIVLAISMTVLVLLQTKGSDLGGFLGGGGSDSTGGYRTRRGVEALMHRITIVGAIIFFVVTVLNFLAWGQTV